MSWTLTTAASFPGTSWSKGGRKVVPLGRRPPRLTVPSMRSGGAVLMPADLSALLGQLASKHRRRLALGSHRLKRSTFRGRVRNERAEIGFLDLAQGFQQHTGFRHSRPTTGFARH